MAPAGAIATAWSSLHHATLAATGAATTGGSGVGALKAISKLASFSFAAFK